MHLALEIHIDKHYQQNTCLGKLMNTKTNSGKLKFSGLLYDLHIISMSF